MRVSRFLGVAAIGTALMVVAAGCGSSSNKSADKKAETPAAKADDHKMADDHGMSAQEMKCMDSQFAKDNPAKCEGAAVEKRPYTLANPIRYTADGLVDPESVDLSGVAGVGPTQQKAAEELLISTAKTLPKWADIETAKAAGFQSIGDGPTGEEHLLRWDWVEDEIIFDPNQPESLVYKVDRATNTKTLEAAMYILPQKYTLDTPPADLDSPLVQFHYHDNLCFSPATPTQGPQVRGLTNAAGECGKSFNGEQLTKFNPNIQVHVWIRKNDCGPFASLLNVGAGQIKDGTERSCVKDHSELGL